jgi:hypothetical protein
MAAAAVAATAQPPIVNKAKATAIENGAAVSLNPCSACP